MRMWLLLPCIIVSLAHPAVSRVLVVDPAGVDGNPGTSRQPLGSIGGAVAGAQPGDLVVVRPGIYRESVSVTRSGVPGFPIVLRGLPGAIMESPNPALSLSAFDVTPNVADVVIEGFELRGGYAETVFLRPGAHNIDLAGLHIHDNRTGIWVAGAHDVTIRDSLIERNFRTGVRIFGTASRIHIVDTRSENNDDGMGCQGDSDGLNADESTTDVLLERVTAEGNSEDGFDLQTPSVSAMQVVARGNGCSGVKLAAGGHLENLVAENNTTGINVSGAPGETAVLRHCTVLNNATGVRATGAGYALSLVNSIIAGPGKALNYAAAVQLTEAANVFYRPLAKDRLIARVDAANEVLYSGNDIVAGRWRRDSGQGVGTMYADPRVIAGTCELRGNSPAIDSADMSQSPVNDLVGALRPSGGGADRGARESVSLTPTLRVRRAVARADGFGTGRLSMFLEITLPANMRFTPATDAVTVAVRGARGTVVDLDAPPSGTLELRKVAARLQTSAAARTTLRLVNESSRVRLWFDARDVALWTVPDGQLGVSVQLGRSRPTTVARLRLSR